MKRGFCVLLSLCMLFSGCMQQENYAQSYVFSMDTVMDLQLWGEDAQTGLDQVAALLNDLAEKWSATEQNSILSRLNRGETVEMTGEEEDLLQQVQELSDRTDGAFYPYMRAVSELWDFQGEEHRIPSDDEITAALAQKQWDLGAAVKGYAGQCAAELLQTMNVERAILNLGGNVQTYGSKHDGSPWRIEIRNPNGGDKIGIVSVSGTMSIVTSGDYQRYFEINGTKYHHLLDPETGWPADSGLCSVTVLCRDGLTADVFSTALFVMGLEEAVRFWRESDDFEAVFILTDGSIYATQGVNLSGCDFEVIKREN